MQHYFSIFIALIVNAGTLPSELCQSLYCSILAQGSTLCPGSVTHRGCGPLGDCTVGPKVLDPQEKRQVQRRTL